MIVNIKKQLIEEIQKIDDKIILEQLSSIVNESDQNIKVEFTLEQLKTIEKSQNQIENGDYVNHDDFLKKIKE